MTARGRSPSGDASHALRLPGRKKPVTPTGLASVDRLATLGPPTIGDYVHAVSEYVREAPNLDPNTKKAAQLRLSYGLGGVLVSELKERIRGIAARAGEHKVAGALRVVLADVSEYHQLDGLRLAVEIKPVNLAVGRALWNRFGDVRAFAVNLHLKFPFAVVGGVLVIPTYEITNKGSKKSTVPLIERTIGRLTRAGRRRNESDAAHLLEGIGVIIYNPDTGEVEEGLPASASGLRWEQFVAQLVEAYDTRFGEGVGASVIEETDEEGVDEEDSEGGEA